jgi:6-phosphogluconolactonase
MNIVEYPDRELMMFSLADTLASELATALRTNKTASLCVPGGTTPGPVFDVLSGVKLDWGRVVVFLNDERWLPETSDRSNGRLLKARLFVGEAAAARYLPLYADTPEPEAALDNLAAAIEPHLPISVLLLGMGADMHTASLFPGADRLADAMAPNAPVLMAMRAPTAPEPRVTLTARVLAGAMSVHILITGPEKR